MKNIAVYFGLFFFFAAHTICMAEQFQEAETALKQRDFDQAAEGFLGFVRSESDHENAPLALYTAARIRALVQDRLEEGKALFRELIDGYPENEWAFYGAMRLAEYAIEQGDSLQAAKVYEEVATIGETIFHPVTDVSDAQFGALKKCGETYLNLRRYHQAEPYFSKLLETNINDRRTMPDVYAKLAACLEGEGEGARAAETYLKLIETYPTAREACGLCQTKEKIDPYASFDWEPYEYFVEGYTVFRTWPSKAAKHMINLETMGGSPDLVQTALRLLPWVYYYSSDFKKARQAHQNFVNRYPDDTDIYVRYFPMYLDSYKEEFEFKQFLTSVSFLVAEADTTASSTPQEEYVSISRADGWRELDLTPHYGYYNQLLYVDRPLNPTDLAYIRIFVKSDSERRTNMEVGNDDPWILWHNGSLLGEFTGNPGKAPLDFIPGWNEIMIKLTQREGDMTATLRFVNDEDESEQDLTCSAVKD
ncbi:MAG: tetratricopeptide repeat protein [Gemmatimonadota bacterium]|nr:MAG: tetratricopeptide repeat protein [Gemmatimonadota bacterium]